MEITIRLETAGEFTDSQLNEYISYCLGCGSCSNDNPFVSEDGNASIEAVDVF